MKAEIIGVGSEVLSGDTINTNAAEVAKALGDIGIDVAYHTVVGDEHADLGNALIIAFNRVDFVVTTGGLGPTYDDMTKDSVAKYFDKPLVYDEFTVKHIRAMFDRNKWAFTDNNMKQAEIIEGASVLPNDYGVAPGIFYQQDGKTVAMLPGPPHEMAPMLSNYLIPHLAKEAGLVIVSKNIRIYGIGESKIESTLHELMISTKNPIIAPYAKMGEVTLKITARASSKSEAEKLIQPIVEQIDAVYHDNIYTTKDKDLQSTLVRKLKKAGQTIATAESCTGGMIASRITEVPGSSGVFGYGVVTYANEAKMKLIGVKEQTLMDYGAVSEQTAKEMAEGVKTLSGADIGVAVTGIAGPDGGTPEKPVGLVYIAIATEDGTKTKQLMLSRGRRDERNAIRQITVSNALFLAINSIKK